MNEKIIELLDIAQKTHANTQAILDEILRFYNFDNFNPVNIQIDILDIRLRCNKMKELADTLEKIQSELSSNK